MGLKLTGRSGVMRGGGRKAFDNRFLWLTGYEVASSIG